METNSNVAVLYKVSSTDEQGRGFSDLAEFLPYLYGGIFGSEYEGKFRYTQARDAATIVLYYEEHIYGHLNVHGKVPLTEEERKLFKCAYGVGSVVPYSKPVPISEIKQILEGERLGAWGATELPEHVFKQILQSGKPCQPITKMPSQETESDEKKSDGELSDRYRTIRQRLRDSKFRMNLDGAYRGPDGPRCAITKCAVEDALEGAHIIPHSEQGPDVTPNGLLLRCDIHAIFDADLLAIDPKTLKVVLAEVLLKTGYREYEGQEIEKPKKKSDHPDIAALNYRWNRFQRKRKG